MFKGLFLPLIAVAAFVVVVGYLIQNKTGLKPATNTNQNTGEVARTSNTGEVSINEVNIPVEIADTDETRRLGLSIKESLPENSGMLFIFPEYDIETNFWMKDMKFDIDIIWINDSKIMGIEKNVPAQPGVVDSELTNYSSPGPVDYVLEVNAGFSDAHNFQVGDDVALDI